MIYRCTKENHIHYDRYGGRGISVCEQWRLSFECFYADMGDRPHGKTLDRIDNNGGYNKENCRWATRSEQNANQFHPKRPGKGMQLTHDGKTMTVKAWSEFLGIKVCSIHVRLRQKYPIEKVLSTKPLWANQYYQS